MANRYWVGNTGNWNDTTHWSTTLGGSGGASVPGISDNAYIGSGLGSGHILSVDTNINCFYISVDYNNGGSISFNNYTVNLSYFEVGSSGLVYLDAATFNVKLSITLGGAIASSGTSTINLGQVADTSAVTTSLAIGQNAFLNVVNLVGNSNTSFTAYLGAANTFNVLNAPKLITFAYSGEGSITIGAGKLNAIGSAGNFIQFGNGTNSLKFNSYQSTPTNCNYIKLQNCKTQGSGVWNAGQNSVDLGGNSGWIFPGKNNAAFFGAAF
jgi:hypothetical protein